MSGADGGLPRLDGNQARAVSPDAHVWLSASAGTGKTAVLTARVFRLLLRGVDPSAILCLTFTKAGAAEMAERISSRLAAWVRMPGTELAADLLALGESATPALVDKARTLFAALLDAPGGGLRIETIHAFCQSLLAAFPLEAGLVPGFRPMEAREEALLAREALADLLVEAEEQGRARIGETIGALSLRLGEGEAERFLHACARAPEAMTQLPVWPETQDFVRRQLGLPFGDIEARIVAGCCDDVFDHDSLDAIGGMNAGWATKAGGTRAALVSAWLDREPEARAQTLGELHTIWAKADGDMRSFGKGQAPQEEGYAELATELYATCAELLALRERAAFADLLAAALATGKDYALAYHAAKRRVGGVDFDDLIRATLALLRQPGMGEWVRFKLDRTTEHVLVDEAQDTNLAQWQIITAIVEEFFVGRGVYAPRTRTLFTVGDFKQAIFGFQGTRPDIFAGMQRHFARAAAAAIPDPDWPEHERGIDFEQLSLTESFRSTAPVLEFVDAAIASMPTPGLGLIADRELHATRVSGPGTVTLWPAITEGGDAEDEEGWIDDATRELADQIAVRLKGWLDGGHMLASKGRPLRPEDVMILVKRRGELASLLVARLYARGVPVAGVDRLRLDAPLAVKDLLAAIRFVLQPDDDLTLANLLVSPIIGWTQEQLLARAVPRKDALWRHLQANEQDGSLADLRAMLARADLVTPYRFLEELLSGPLDARRKLLARLGNEARDPIDELLSAALDFETTGSPTLQRFLDWFDRGEVEIKRDPSQPLDAVRVMTAHAAKGLQAPLVILADATLDPTKSPRSTLEWTPEGFAAPLPIFRPRREERFGPLADLVEAAEQRELEEHWRLFYVAATRAEEQLVIAGALGPMAKGQPWPLSWHAVAGAAMSALDVPVGESERVFTGTQAHVHAKRDMRERTPLATVGLPDWARRAAPVEARPPRPLAPSSLGEDLVADPPPSAAMRAAAERGRLIHALFQRLPALAVGERAAAARRWLAGQGCGAAAADEIAALVCAVIADPELAALFGPDSLAEAPIAATIAQGVVVSGTVDRLLVRPSRVEVIDFKTGRSAPERLEDVPTYHLRQMAAYAAALAVIFPRREIVASLLYTAGPRRFALPADWLARHKPGFAGADQSLSAAG